MNPKIVAGAALVAASVGLSIKDYFKIKREQEKIRKELDAELQADLQAIHSAKAVILDRISRGEYDGRGHEAVLNDIRFETIIQRY